MKVTIEHNGEVMWFRDSHHGVGMTSTNYLTNGMQEKIIAALSGALVQACGELLGPIAIKPDFSKASEAIAHLKAMSRDELISELVKAGIAKPD
ncbi:hypothetical protein ABLA30_17345 [Xenorhabdus nematophila]|uniref:hypothetical protein n=1 Tax=Xenorhabdus nematophila TaxID=628 RepID=UPI0032B71DF8